MRTVILFSTSIIAALALAGCTSHTAPSPVTNTLSALSPATHNPVAAYSDYETSSQLAEGLFLAGIAEGDIRDYHDEKRGKLPTNAAQAKSVEPHNYPKFDAPGKYVGSVAVGPTPGVVTVEWARGALAGESLVLVPERPGGSNPYLCFRVDASTTVPVETLALVKIVNECQTGE